MKLAKFLAHAGVASRRKAEELIEKGQVKVNGQVQRNVAERVTPGKDTVEFKNRLVEVTSETIILALHKPTGVVSTVSDPDGKPTVMDYVPAEYAKYRLYPVGRLDEDSSGLILLTNDGDLAYSLTHPSKEVAKTYRVMIAGKLTYPELSRLRTGVPLKDGKTQPAQVNVLDEFGTSQLVEITITEGRHRQVRRMMEAVNHEVEELKRLSMGPYVLGNLKVGKVRPEVIRPL